MDDHNFISQLFEVAATVDQLNTPALRCFELAARRYQLWEAAYEEQLRQADAGDAGAAWLSERDLFLGTEGSSRLALVMPELREHVAEKLADRAYVLRERRKAREEADLVAGSATARPKGRDDDDDDRRRGPGGRRGKNR